MFCFPQQLLNQFIFLYRLFHSIWVYFCILMSAHYKHQTLLACPIWHVASQIFLRLSFPSSLFFTLSKSRALLHDLNSRNVPFSHDAPGGDKAISGPVREAVSASPVGWGRGVTAEMSLSVSLCHTNSGRTTNGLVFQSFLSYFFFFVCALSSIHLFMFPLLSPFSSPLLSFLFPPTILICLSLSLSTCLTDFAAVVCSSAGGHADFPRGQAARRQPATPSQPGYTLPTHQHTPTEWQEPQLPATKQD